MDAIVQIDAFFDGRPQQWGLFDALDKAIEACYPKTRLRVMKKCIVFDDPRPYCYVSLPKKKSMEGLLVTISLTEMREHPRFFMVVPVSRSRVTVHIHIENEKEIDEELLEWIAESHR